MSNGTMARLIGGVDKKSLPRPTTFQFLVSRSEGMTQVEAETPVKGWKTRNINNLRLWSAKPIGGFDLQVSRHILRYDPSP
jgi:hypothetical protein